MEGRLYEVLPTKFAKSIGLLFGVFIVFAFMVASAIFGLTNITWQMMLDSFLHFDGSNEHLIIRESRVPRALIGAAVGASLAISGALMQGLTRNPLASPGLFGINAGAGFFSVLAVTVFSVHSLTQFTWITFGGAAISAVILYLLGSLGRDGLTPMKITLAGAALASLFLSLTQGMLTLNEKALEEVLFWLAGSVEGRSLDALVAVLPYFIAGWGMALAITGKMNALTIGEDVAKGLGQRTMLVKIVAGLVVVLLAGGSVAVAGPIGFVGIVVPHMARALVGADYRWIMPYSGMLGALLLIGADIGARYIIMPKEIPVGVMTALIGAPFFIYIARKGMSRG